MNSRTIKLVAALATTLTAALSAGPALAGTIQIKGVLHIASGSYIRMGLPAGGYFTNPYSTLSDKTYTGILGGTGGGLKIGAAQAQPSPGFDSHGNSLANSIISPANFTGIKFGVVTTVPPSAYVTGSKLTVYVRHLYAEWNKQTFLQGAIAFGTYNSATHAYTLSWRTTVHGGPFDGYIGNWHLQGTFAPA